MSCALMIFSFSQSNGQDFVATVVKGCAPLRVKFSTSALGTYAWTFGKTNNNTSDLREPEVVYDIPGKYTVALTVNGGPYVTKVEFIEVYDPPAASFSLTYAPGCAPVDVEFRNTTISTAEVPITEYHWVFGDGDDLKTNTTILHHTYKLGGLHSVSLTAGNASLPGCISTKVSDVKVEVLEITAKFSSTTSFCAAPAAVDVVNTSSGPAPLQYSWLVDGELRSTDVAPELVIAEFGTHAVTLRVAGKFGCLAETVQTIKVGNKNFSITTDKDKICNEGSIMFSIANGEYINDWKWDFGNDVQQGQQLQQQVKYKEPGTYSVKFRGSTSDCEIALQKVVTVYNIPTAKFNHAGSCNNEVLFYNQSTDATIFEWNFGDGSTSNSNDIFPTHTYASSGSYQVTLLAKNEIGCVADIFTRTVTAIVVPSVFIGPQASPSCFGPSLTGCAPFAVDFQSSVSPTAFAAQKIQWTFSDGQTSSAGNPHIVFDKPGTYKARLEITALTGGCVGSTEATVTVLDPSFQLPELVLDKNEVCVEEEVTLKASSPSPMFLCWSTERDSHVTGNEVKYKFKEPGQKTITLTVPGCKAEKVFTNAIKVKDPFTNFSLQQYCPRPDDPDAPSPFDVDFINKSTEGEDLIYKWDFGDGTTSDLRTPPRHSYPVKKLEAIHYNISLTVTDPESNCSITLIKVADVHELTVDFDVRGVPADNTDPARAIQACKGDEIQFTNKSKFAYLLEWYFGNDTPTDPAAKVGEAPTKRYTVPGTYNVRLRAGDGLCSLEKSMSIPITVPDIDGAFSFTGKSDCEKLTVQFQDKTRAVPPVSRWDWNFGNGKTSTEQNPQTTYATLGLYDVSLHIGNDLGECTIPLKNGLVFTKPSVDFTATRNNACIDEAVQINADVRNTNKIRWDFGNGTTSAAFSPRTSYSKVGTYDVSASATDIFGCEITFNKARLINITKPTADFSFDRVIKECPPLITSFTDRSENAKSWLWNFGDGETASMASPVNTYKNPGTYSVSLTVKDQNGCSDTRTMTDLIRLSGPTGIFTNVNKTNCTNDTIKFESQYKDAIQVQWDFGDGNIEINNSSTVQHSYSISGKVQPLVLLRDERGCEIVYRTTPEMIIAESPDTTFFIEPTAPFTDDDIYLSTPSGSSLTSWNLDGIKLEGDNVQLKLEQPGILPLVLEKIDDKTGCTTIVIKNIRVHGYPDFVPNVFTPNEDLLNDRFEIPGLERSSWGLRIFNRWGKTVFDSPTYDSEWRASELAAGIYYYELRNIFRPEKVISGWVHVIH